MSSPAHHTATIYFSYSQFLVFDSSVSRPGCAWTERHYRQGFARRERNASFGTLLEFGHARVALHLRSYEKSVDDKRVVEVPIEVISGELVIAGPDELPSQNSVRVPPGSYRLVVAQAVVDHEHEEIRLFLEKLSAPIPRSRLIVADEQLDATLPLLETVEVA